MDAECILIPPCDAPTRDYMVTHYTHEGLEIATSLVVDCRSIGSFVQPTLPPHTTHIPVFKPPGDGQQSPISYVFPHGLAFPGYLRHVRASWQPFPIYMCIRILLLATDSIADTCVTRGSFFLFSLHPNFAVRYWQVGVARCRAVSVCYRQVFSLDRPDTQHRIDVRLVV